MCSLGALSGGGGGETDGQEIRKGEKDSTLGTQETGPGPVGNPLPGSSAKCPTGNFTSERRETVTLGGELTSQARACLQI